MTNDGLASVERRIREHQGAQFYTQSGLPMTHLVDGDQDQSSQAMAVDGGGEGDLVDGTTCHLTDVDQRINGRAYLFAILRDPRVAAWDLN